MRKIGTAFLAFAASVALAGCVARTAAKGVSAPVDLASGAVDAMTTSQSAADEKRGRELREREERLGKLERRYREQSKKCENGSRSACAKAADLAEEIEDILPTIPVEPERL